MTESISKAAEFRHVEAYKRSQLAKLHGLPEDHHLIKPNDPAYLPKVNDAIIALGKLESGKSTTACNVSGVAPAAGAMHARRAETPAQFVRSLKSPRSGNTGGTYFDEESGSKILRILGEPSPFDDLVKIDWLTVTWPTVKDELEQRALINQVGELLGDVDIESFPRGRGLHNYEHSEQLKVFHAGGNAYSNVGMLAWSDRGESGQGVMLELSGQGCRQMDKDWLRVAHMIMVLGGRISRVDFALDLPADYCKAKGITVPKLGRECEGGGFRSKYTPAKAKISHNMQGEWGLLTFGHVSVDEYDPEFHAPRGLTYYHGNYSSSSQIVFYEKGKQLLGCVPDNQMEEFNRLLTGASTSGEKERLRKMMDKAGYDPGYENHKSWVRVERRVRYGSNKKEISPAMLVRPADAFCNAVDDLGDMLSEFAAWVLNEGFSPAEIRTKSAGNHKAVLLTRKLYWAKMAYGRLVRTLQDEGLTAGEIIDKLTRDAGLKDYVFDLMADTGGN